MSDAWVVLVAALACLALLVTAAGTVVSNAYVRRPAPVLAGGPYRSRAAETPSPARARGAGLMAIGSAIMSFTVGPALVVALLTLRWEGIGVALLPAIALAAARFYAASLTLRSGALDPLRTVASASLLLDVPLAFFAFLHVRMSGGHDEPSLAAVASYFAVADGLNALFVLGSRSP